MKKILFILFTALAIFANADILLWQVDIYNNATVDGVENTGVYTFLSQRYDNELDAMVVACDRQGNVIAPLMLVQDPDFADIPLNDEYGALNPWQNQTIQSWTPDEMTQEMLFMMQVGIYDEDFNFTPILYSNYASSEEISRHTHTVAQLAPIAGDWAPGTYYTVVPLVPVPEPTAGLLFLLGIGFLCLKRKSA